MFGAVAATRVAAIEQWQQQLHMMASGHNRAPSVVVYTDLICRIIIFGYMRAAGVQHVSDTLRAGAQDMMFLC